MSVELVIHRWERARYPALDLRRQVFPYWILSYVVEGSVATLCRGQEVRAEAGWLMAHPPYQSFDERADGAGLHEYVGFTLREGKRDALPTMPLAFPIRRPLRVRRLLGLVIDGDAVSRCRAVSQLAEVAAREGLASGLPLLPRLPVRFSAVVDWVERSESEPLTRASLAAIAGMHPGAFDRAFRAEYGVAPLALARKVRLRKAVRAWMETGQTLETIAERFGYGDASALSRLVKSATGKSPRQLREGADSSSFGTI